MEKKATARREELFSHGFMAPELRPDDIVPMGGSMFTREKNPKEYNTFMRVDSEALEPFLERVDRNVKAYPEQEREKLRQWYEQVTPSGDFETFFHLTVFQRVLDVHYPDAKKEVGQRTQAYTDSSEPFPLSQAFEKKIAACTEHSALAQLYLQRQGFESYYVDGNIAEPRETVAEEGVHTGDHAYVLVRNPRSPANNAAIYDPIHPVRFSTGQTFASVMDIEGGEATLQQWKEQAKEKPAFMVATDPITKQAFYYGVTDDYEMYPERDIVRQAPQEAIDIGQLEQDIELEASRISANRGTEQEEASVDGPERAGR